MSYSALPQHRGRMSGPGRLGGADRFSPSHHKHRTSRGKHHLLVSLQLKLGLGRGCLLVALQCLGFLLTAAAVMLLAGGRLSMPAFGSSRPLDTEQHRILLATHNRLAWYYPYQDAMRIIHGGEGVHYGMFPGDALPHHPHTVWNIIRPHNWRPSTEKEYLVQLDADTGAELVRVEIPSRFSHDAVRIGDRVYVCSTGKGSILELSYPNMTLLRSMPLFSDKDHPNTLAAVEHDPEHLWVLLHNLGESDLVKVYIGPDRPPHEVSRVSGVGTKSHGLVAWGHDLILLDSDNGALVSLDVEGGDVYDLYMVPEEGKFLKGLAVLDDIAYFGITTWAERSVRDSPTNDGELVAFDLVNSRLLWRRTVPTSGLLNIIGAPHLAIDSTYAATYSRSNTADLMRAALDAKPTTTTQPAMVLPDSEALVQRAVDALAAAGYPPLPINPADYWSSGWPRLNPEPKLTEAPEEAGLQLPLFHANITALQARVLALPDEAWGKEHQAAHNVAMTGRNQNMDKFKPGVEGIVLVFSDNEGSNVYEFPYYDLLRQELEPLLLEILGPADINNIVRLQLARMAPGASDIKTHQDMGGYALHGHRIHIPLVTHPLVSFSQCPDGDGTAAAIVQGLAAAAAAAAGGTAPGALQAGAGGLQRRLAAAAAAAAAAATASPVGSVVGEEMAGAVGATGSLQQQLSDAQTWDDGVVGAAGEQLEQSEPRQGTQQHSRSLLLQQQQQQQSVAEPAAAAAAAAAASGGPSQPPSLAEQQQWVAQQQAAAAQAAAGGHAVAPRPPELLPVESVPWYYTGYGDRNALLAGPDDDSAALTLPATHHKPRHQQQQQQQQQSLRQEAQAAPAPAGVADLPAPPELQPVDPQDVYYVGDAAREGSPYAAGVETGAAANTRQPQQAPQPHQQGRRQHHKLRQQGVLGPHPAAQPTGQVTTQHQQQQQQQQQQRQRKRQMALLKQRRQRPCTKLFTPEGLVFELNNRVPHKVSNPSASGTSRIHLVLDVFESSRARTPLAPGSTCEYGALPAKALSHLQDMLLQQVDLEVMTDEIRAIVASPGMTCVGPDGRRVNPLRKARMTAAEAGVLQQQEEMVQELLAQLQGVANTQRRAAAAATLDSVH